MGKGIDLNEQLSTQRSGMILARHLTGSALPEQYLEPEPDSPEDVANDGPNSWSAWVPTPNGTDKSLIHIGLEGSRFGADLHPDLLFGRLLCTLHEPRDNFVRDFTVPSTA